MLHQVELRNFRRHEHLTLNLASGLNAIRAPNEGGKSSVLEALAYALFGTRVLRSSLEDTVTWGRPVSTLRVTLTLTAEGRTLVFSRGKSGAEVTEQGNVLVTGQMEVSLFAAKILGADISVAGKLMFATQGNLRGSLEAGPKATAELIESLADFDLFNRILESAQQSLMLGSPAVLETNLANAQAQLHAFEMPIPVDEAAIRAEFENQVRHETWVASEVTRLKAEAAKRTATWQTHKDIQDLHVTADAQLQSLAQQVEQKTTLAQAERKAADNIKVTEADVTKEVTLLSELQDHATRIADYRKFLTLSNTGEIWDQDQDSLDAELVRIQGKIKETDMAIAETGKLIAVLESTLITSSVCGFCGQDVSAFPDVAKRNRETQDKITAAQRTLAQMGDIAVSLRETERRLTEVRRVGQRVLSNVMEIRDRVSIDMSTVPPRVLWVGTVPQGQAPDTTLVSGRILALRKALEDRQRHMARASVLEEEIVDINQRMEAAKAKKAGIPPFSEDIMNTAEREADELAVRYMTLEGELLKGRESRKQAEADLTSALVRQAHATSQHEILTRAVGQCQENLENLHFNNALVKKIRAARPIIGDKLWTMVLASVSTLFTVLRGERSVVTKDKDGFQVNGQNISGLSGSTLDILGLAIRIALVRTFLPTCDFIVLDEPGAACDASRTATMLGFLQASGFSQTLLVTHDEASESVADNLIQL